MHLSLQLLQEADPMGLDLHGNTPGDVGCVCLKMYGFAC